MSKYEEDRRRIKSAPEHWSDCTDPLHAPIRSLHTGPGQYRHVCPECGKETFFTIPNLSEFE
jgi:hypothetical protein